MRKKTIIIMLTLVTICSLSFAVSCAQALPIMGRNNWFNIFSSAMSKKPLQKNWVHVDGIVTDWGTTNATGFLSTHVKTTLLNTSDTRQLSSTSAIWTLDKLRPLFSAVRTKENLTYTIYSAKLWNASVAELSYDEADFFMSGTWNVNTVTITVTVITNSSGNIISVHRDTDITPTTAYGELTVTDNWTKFNLAIENIDPVTGAVKRSVMKQMQWNPFKITGNPFEITDDITSSTTESVTKTDLNAVVNCYGNMPGWGNYDQKMDFNFNYRIDIADIATVAANVQ